MSKPASYQKSLLSVAEVPFKDILESTQIPENVFLKDFIEFVLDEHHRDNEFSESVWQMPEDLMTPGIPRDQETERVRQVLITWASLYKDKLYGSISEMFELDMSNIEQIIDVQLLEGTQLLVEIELVGDE